jgi:hypothetical protein
MDEDFEKQLIEMAKPEITRLAHEDLLVKAITNANAQTTVSLWWLSIPIYFLASFLMKLYFVRGSTLSSTFLDFLDKNSYTAVLLLVIIPLLLILVNLRSLRKMHIAANGNMRIIPLRSIVAHCLFILVSIIILLIYVLS